MDDLDTYFCRYPMEIEGLLKLADQIVEQYLTTETSEHASSSNNVGS